MSVGIRPEWNDVSYKSNLLLFLFVSADLHKQAKVFVPLMFMAQLPQMPSLQLLRKVRVGSNSFLIRTRASSTMGPVLFRSNVYVCIFGFSVGVSGFHR